MIIFLLIFLLSIAVLIISANTFVNLTTKISLKWKISSLIIGTTVVALGTSLPELAVSTLALLRNDQGLAIGNIIGSNILNILLILPIGIILGKLHIGTTKTQRNALIMLATTLLFVWLYAISYLSIISGVILVTLAVVFTIGEYYLGVLGRSGEDKTWFSHHHQKKIEKKDYLLLPLSFVGIVGGGFLTVYSIEGISLLTGYSTTLLGLTVSAIATSLPELLTTIVSQKQNQEKITLGNIMGSNIYNLLLIGGVIAFSSSPSRLPFINWLIFIIAAVLLTIIVFIYRGRVVPKIVGYLLLFLCLIYFLTLK